MSFSTISSMDDEESLLPSSPTFATPVTSDIIGSYLTKVRQFPRTFAHLLGQLVIFSIPSFLRRSPTTRTLCEKASGPLFAQKKNSTEYLDGVRGVASFIVFLFHWTHLHFPGTNTGYRYRKGNSLWQLPIIRFVYSGAAMVSIFFVVSGYVLSHRFVQKMHSHDFESLFTGLTSLTFRRFIRLFLPASASCLLAYLCASLRLIDVEGELNGKEFHHGLSALLKYIDLETTPWTWDLYMKGFYNPQLWSISLEFRGSMVVFLVILGLARSRASIRLVVQLLISSHAFGHRRWDVGLFVIGMSIAEVDVLMNTSAARKAMMQKRRIKVLLWIMILVGIFLAGFPRDHGTKSLGYGFTKNIWPYTDYRRRFWLSIASILIVAPMPYLPVLHSFFNLSLIRYLGKISFAIYLIHGLTNRIVGRQLMYSAWVLFGNDSYWTYAVSYIVSSIVYVPLVIWWSDVFWRAFDLPAMQFAKWLEGKCLSKQPT